ncbi:flagellar switch protein [Novosphingobium sp. NBM11]|uniref:FliM/FliN family flagellar motor switch protein n=1 Tax=Novosphingobium sp. NBM11 TaxID=2596914 RepID=UPI00189254A3|nr:FliM/FliN family flagellar motor switch protein [Novosphingobium sp. NBM11]MBF5091471.1 flagellar switch protein [Novosphingobium sp. NBM11]
MKPERAFIAERPLAQHSEALLRPGPGPAELIPALSRATERFARSLRVALAPLLSNEGPQVAVAEPTSCNFKEFVTTVESLAANSLMAAGSQAAPLLCTIEAEAVLSLVDRAFGGRGQVPEVLPREFPLSAELMIDRLERQIGIGLAAALGSNSADAVQPIRRDSSLRQLHPFPAATQLAVLTVSVTEEGLAPWTMRIAFPLTTLAHLFGHGEKPPIARTRVGPADPLSQPFADMPLPVSALLVDVALPLSTISSLEVGQILSLPIARNIPVRVGKRTIAHGTLGSVDDRVAIQITNPS